MRGLKLNESFFTSVGLSRIFYRCVDWNKRIELYTVRKGVASFTDAWIETKFRHPILKLERSHLLQMRGLKPSCYRNPKTRNGSHLLQMRGLKHIVVKYNRSRNESHLLQMRGLKLTWHSLLSPILGRIFYRCVDWNANIAGSVTCPVKSHLLQMRGLKPLKRDVTKRTSPVASFTDAWIETASFVW